jgi:hypothetical protein
VAVLLLYTGRTARASRLNLRSRGKRAGGRIGAANKVRGFSAKCST